MSLFCNSLEKTYISKLFAVTNKLVRQISYAGTVKRSKKKVWTYKEAFFLLVYCIYSFYLAVEVF